MDTRAWNGMACFALNVVLLRSVEAFRAIVPLSTICTHTHTHTRTHDHDQVVLAHAAADGDANLSQLSTPKQHQ